MIKVAQFGLGPIGQHCVHLLANQSWCEIVGGVDIDPARANRPLADVCNLPGESLGQVHTSFEELWDECQPDAILHTAGSRAAISFEQCRPMLERGLAVVSSCEELLFPLHRAPELTAEIDALCQESGGRILGTGVNPGFVLDYLPVALSGVCRSVSGIYGKRVVNATLRREPLQRKIGSGLAPDAYLALWNEGKAGHAGFQESLLLLAHAFGWVITDVQETLEPVIAETAIRTDYFTVEAGQVRGLHQIVKAESLEGHRIELDLTMALDEPAPHDYVRLDSDPPIECRIEGGVSGDKATVASVVNALPRLLQTAPGVRLVTDLPASANPQLAHKSSPANQQTQTA